MKPRKKPAVRALVKLETDEPVKPVQLTAQQLGEHIGRLSDSLHHKGFRVPGHMYVIDDGDKFCYGGTLSLPGDRVRVLLAAATKELARAFVEQDELKTLAGPPAVMRADFADLRPNITPLPAKRK